MPPGVHVHVEFWLMIMHIFTLQDPAELLPRKAGSICTQSQGVRVAFPPHSP